jgi:hypothetical protein
MMRQSVATVRLRIEGRSIESQQLAEPDASDQYRPD